MLSRVKPLLGNFALLAATLLVIFLYLEYGVFKYIFPADDVLPNVTINKVVRYQPDTQATFHRPDGSTDFISINADGWNSTKPFYRLEKKTGKLRIAVIGDSYVHGSFVDVDQGFPEVLERRLQGKGFNAEVFRFGTDGAPLSQYLHMMRKEVLRYQPDIVVVQLTHNDFDESYRFMRSRYSSSFMKLVRERDGRIYEMPAKDFKPGLADKLRKFRTFRYLYYQTGLHKKASYLVNRYWWGGSQKPDALDYTSSAIDIRNIRQYTKIRKISRYVFDEMKALADKHGFKLAFAMDGVREAIYSGKNLNNYEVSSLNDIVRDQMVQLKLPFVDYQKVFAAHYAEDHKRFEFSYDWRWNALGNRLVGETIAELIATHPKLLGTKPLASREDVNRWPYASQ